MASRKIVHVRAEGFRRALYVDVDDDVRYLVSTDYLCPDCSCPLIVLDGCSGDGSVGALYPYHDAGCLVAYREWEAMVSESDESLVALIRDMYLTEALEVWSS